MNPIKKATLLLCELGPSQLAENLCYRAKLRSGWLAMRTPQGGIGTPPHRIDFSRVDLFSFDWVNSTEGLRHYIHQADEVVSGYYPPFGGKSEPLDLTLPQPLQHWTKYGDSLASKDIKEYWEPARFGWVIPLCIAYVATKDERYPAAFWNYFDIFIQNNPVNMGLNWSSAQEVALRLIPWTMAGQVFSTSITSEPEKMTTLSRAIWDHCQRIPLTLDYAHSQFNNHWLSEALGLMIGGWLFKDTPQGKRWLSLGNKEFQTGIRRLVDAEGTFSQHSNNYHRMLLQLCLLFNRITQKAGLTISVDCSLRIDQATRWLAGQMDARSGEVPNLGHNDGTHLLPIGSNEYCDYRPTLQAACLAFLGAPCLEKGRWDDLSACLGLDTTQRSLLEIHQLTTPAIHRIGNDKLWSALRACNFLSRPAHADLLHTDIWFDGINIAVDPGTYAYNLPTPWDNSLMKTCVHNTVTVDNQDQMYRAGKFLWLDHTIARLLDETEKSVTAEVRCSNGIAYTQTRTIVIPSDHQLEITDAIGLPGNKHTIIPVTIQWLVADGKWKINGQCVNLEIQGKPITLEVTAGANHNEVSGDISLIRAGENLAGNNENPICGWFSETYLQKTPALSFAVTFNATGTIQIRSLWSFPAK